MSQKLPGIEEDIETIVNEIAHEMQKGKEFTDNLDSPALFRSLLGRYVK